MARGMGWRGGALIGAMGLAATLVTGCELFPGQPAFVVTTTADGHDADIGDGVCEVTSGVGDCSLRAAIDEANAASLPADITVPSATYALTIVGADDTNGAGDLDLAPASGAMVVEAASSAGFAIDASAVDGGLDIHGGNIALFGVGVAGSGGDGVRVRAGGLGAFTFSSIHGSAGAGVAVDAGAKAQLWATTVSGNGAGGVANHGLTTTRFATIAANTGGGITGVGDDGPDAGVRLDSSLVASQVSGIDCADGLLSSAYSTSTDNTCWVAGPGNYGTPGPLLDPLSGGFLPIHRLIYPGPTNGRDDVPVGSGSCITGSPLMTDQLGQARPVGPACDRGASEGPVPSDLVVDDASDQHDIDPGDGVCENPSGTCDLRSAVDEANAWSGDATVTIQAGIDPQLSIVGAGDDANATGDLDVTEPLTLVGNGATITAVAGDRILDLHTGYGLVAISDLTLVGGDASADARDGGAIWSDGVLTLTDVVIDHPVGAAVGAIDHEGIQMMTLTDVTISGAQAADVAVRTSYATLLHVTVADTVGGGGISVNGGSITESSFTGNGGTGIIATAPPDGAIERDLDIYRSTIAGNVADAAGGAIRALAGSSVYLNDSTLSGNVAPVGAAVATEPAVPGGWFGGSVSIIGSTVVGNEGASSIAGSSGALRSALAAGSGSLCANPIGSQGDNVTTDGTCGFSQPTDQVVADLLVGPLADNGGPTLTHLPAPDSPLIDAIPIDVGSATCYGSTIDQRGAPRPSGPACDAGSVEAAVSSADLVVDTAADGTDTDPGDGACATAAGACSLRAAIDESNATTDVETIAIADGIDPVLSIAGRDEDANATGDLDITEPVVIRGGGATIEAGGIDRLLDSRSVIGLVSLLDLTLQGGDASSGPGAGAGAIAAAGGLRLDGVAVLDNGGSGIGAIGVVAVLPGDGTIPDVSRTVLTDTEVAGNDGGPAISVTGGHVTLERADVHDNVGGGVAVNGRDLVVRSSTVHGNSAGQGAGIAVTTTNTASIGESWIHDNHATGSGGGVFASGGSLQLSASTLSANTANGSGGAIAAPSTTVGLTTTTVSGNSASAGGAVTASTLTAMYATIVGNVGSPSVSITVFGSAASSIIAAPSGPACSTSSSAYALEFNLFGDSSCGSGGSNVVGVPGLGPLQDNGGPTPTHLAPSGSPARDAVPYGATFPSPFGPLPACPFFTSPPTDQRGVSRPQGGACDKGATES